MAKKHTRPPWEHLLALSLPVCECRQNRIQHVVQLFARVLREKAQDEIAMVLQQRVLSAVATVGFRIREMLRPVQFDDNTRVRTKEVHFHHSPVVERDGQLRVQAESPGVAW